MYLYRYYYACVFSVSSLCLVCCSQLRLLQLLYLPAHAQEGAVRSRGILDLINSIINQIPYKVDTPTPLTVLYLQSKSQAFITSTKHFTPPSTVVIKSNLIGQNFLAHLKTNPFFIYLKLIIY